MLDIVGIGALNFDYIATRSRLARTDRNLVAELSQRFEHGTEKPAEQAELAELIRRRHDCFDAHLGGSAFNALRAASSIRAGLALGYVGVEGTMPGYHVAGDTRPDAYAFGSWLSQHQIDKTFVRQTPSTGGICVSFIRDGERSLLTFPGANAEIADFLRSSRASLVQYLAHSQIVHVTSLFDAESPPLLFDLVSEAVRMNPGLILSFDPGHHWVTTPPAGIENMYARARYVFLNYREFRALGERALGLKEGLGDGVSDLDFASALLKHEWHSRSCIVTLKRYDCIKLFFLLRDEVVPLKHQNVVLGPAEIEDATGAGDIFAGGFLAGSLVPGLELRDRIELGLRMVREKLRHAGASGEKRAADVFENIVEEAHKRQVDYAALTVTEASTQQLVPDSARPERLNVLHDIFDAIREFQGQITLDDLPPWAADRTQLLQTLVKTRIGSDPCRDEFCCDVLEDSFSIGEGLLQPLIPLTREQRAEFGKLMFVHEVYHASQGLTSVNYPGIGRAGIVLEGIDYWADAVAVGILSSIDIRRTGEVGKAKAKTILEQWICGVLGGINVFDRMIFGPRISRLYERRMRRYLIWHLQRARARTTDSTAHVCDLLNDRPVVELAPVVSEVDSRGDKIINEATNDTCIFVSMGRKIVRVNRKPSVIDPSDVIEYVRTGDLPGGLRVARAIVDHDSRLFCPWRNANPVA